MKNVLKALVCMLMHRKAAHIVDLGYVGQYIYQCSTCKRVWVEED